MMSAMEEKQPHEEIRTTTGVGFILLVLYVGFVFFEPQQFFEAAGEPVRVTYGFGIFMMIWAILFTSFEMKKRRLKT